MQVAREIAERGKQVIENDFDSKFNSNVVSIHYKGGIA